MLQARISEKFTLNYVLIEKDMFVMSCNVCSSQLGPPVYESTRSLTSLCDVYPESTRVRICEKCGHLQTDSIENIDSFYDREYTILVDSEDEDQIYEIRDGNPIYRTAHQLNTFMSKVPLREECKILDFGCAKSSMMNALSSRYSGITPHLFDVSDRYIPFWNKFMQPEHWATYDIPDKWTGQFDVVTSFFSLEHIEKPTETLSTIKKLLKPGGLFYCIVPNVFTNIADFLVIDHVNHFTESSLQFLCGAAGLKVKEIDSESHTGAFVVIAELDSDFEWQSPGNDEEREFLNALKIVDYWNGMAENVREFESNIPGMANVAIYGAGFYGAFIAGCMKNPQKVNCLIDQNPFLYGKDMRGVPVVSPDDLPGNVDTILVGLNPAYASDIIQAIPSFASRDITFFYL